MFPTTKTITISLQLSCACLLCTDKMGPTTTPRVYLYHSSNVPGYVILHYPSKARLSCHASTLFCAVTCLQFNNHIFIFKTLYCKFLFTQTTYIEVRKQKIGLNESCNLLCITGVQFKKLSFRAIRTNPDDHKQISHLQFWLVIPLSLGVLAPKEKRLS